MRPRSRRSALLLALLTPLVVVPARPAQAVGFSPAQCRIEYVSNPHLTNSPGVLAVKVNSKIQCDRPVDDLVLTVRLYQTPDKQTAKSTTDNSGKPYLFNEQTYTACKTANDTEWFGRAWGTSVEGGKAYFSDPRGMRSNTVSLPCDD